ncbi:MAG: ABC transporter ATP-binding protein [Parasporobacterium sp.]|nr:ABC transporter ATP-binding protein [Parasporobacterium sp.]
MHGRHGGHEKASFKYLMPLFRYIKKFMVPFIIAILLSVVGTIFTIMGPNYISQIADLVGAGLDGSPIDLQAITGIGIFLACIYGGAFVLNYFQSFIMTIVWQKTGYRLRQDLSEKINRLPLRYFDNTLIGDILSRITNDVDTVTMTLHQSVGNLAHFLTQFLGALFFMFITNWVMTLVAIGAAILGFLGMILIMKHSQKYFNTYRKELGAINGHNEEIYSGHNVVRVYNAEAREQKKFDKINNNMFNAGWRSHFFSSIMPPLMAFVGNLGYVGVCVVGSIMALNGQITFGVVVAFMIYIRQFTQPLQQFGQIFTQLQSTAAASKRVFEFIDVEEMENDSQIADQIDHSSIKGDIEFKNVKFGYDPENVIIKNFSAVAKAGQKVAIVGPTGAGKTTMVNLLMRFYDVDQGEITIDGVNTRNMRRDEVHGLFGMVLQDTWLFEGSIKENIKYNTDATDEQVVEAAKNAGLHHFVMTLANGYDTILNEDANVSQGQKQLITIARAMVEDAPFLILDEATSSVDTRTEELIQQAMDRLMAGRTSFVIAHRLSTIRNADLILVMKEGDIIEQGNHEELLAQNGFYAELYNSQFDSID